MQSCSGLLQLSTGETFTSLTSALISSNSSFQVLFLDSESYQMTTFGSHSSLALICQNNTLAISAMLLVPSETWVKFSNCQMTSEVTTGALISVFGSVELEGGGVFALKVSAFILYGSLALHNSNFAFNTKSLYVASLFGFSPIDDSNFCQMTVIFVSLHKLSPFMLAYSTVTLFARFRGWSTSVPLRTAT